MAFNCATTQRPGNAMQRLKSRLNVDRKRLIVSLLIVCFAGPSFSQNSDVIPPVIIEGPPAYQAYNPRGMISLPCTASGTLPLTHDWYRNGDLLDPKSSSNIQKAPDGSLNLNQPVEGYYQCRVENGAGVAVSNLTFLQSAVFQEEIKRPTETIVRDAFQPLLMPCNHIRQSIPAPSIRWVRWEYGKDRDVVLSDRITYSENGSLVFTALLPTDSNPDEDGESKYKCIAYNYMTQREIGGSYYRLKVKTTDGGNQNRAPVLIDSSNDTVRVREGQQLKLSCIFGGVNMSGARWTLPNKTVLSPRWQLNIPNAKTSDRGNYTCCYVVGEETLTHTTMKVIKVIVDALPRLEAPLQGQRVQRGGSAHFTCRGIGQPTPKVSWIINGTTYNGTEYNSTQLVGFQYLGSIRGHSLTLLDVQSSASVACNVSNEHGYHLSSSYLIVGDNIATTSSQSQSSLMPSSTDVTTRETTSSTSGDGSSSTPSTIKMPSSTGIETVAKTSSTISSRSYESKNEESEQKSVSETTATDSKMSILVPVAIGVGIVIILLIAVSGCIVYRRKKKQSSYSLDPKDQQIGLKAGCNSREQDPTACDSDDSGYDDVGRKPITNLKHMKRLSDTPEETFLSHL